MPDGFPPSVLMLIGGYALLMKTTVSFKDFYFWLGIILILLGIYLHMAYTKIKPFDSETWKKK